ncbi:hypothetical protein [Cupriavidus necator]
MMTAMVVGTAHITLQIKHAYSRMDGCLAMSRNPAQGDSPRFSGTVAMIGQT